MKRLLIFWFLLGAVVVASLAQTVSLWTGNVPITTTPVDTTFGSSTTDWYSVSIWPDGCDMWIQIASPGDTASIATRDSVLITDGTVVTFPPVAKLRQLRYQADSGSGRLYLVGTKRGTH